MPRYTCAGVQVNFVDIIWTVKARSKIVALLTLLLAVYVSPWSLALRLAISVVAVLMVFREDLFGRWRTRSRTQIQRRIDELNTREFIRKHQRLSY
jgi:hypothetical protein